MILAFRVDAATIIGSGHVMRCLALAQALKLCGHECIFVCRLHSGHLNEHIAALGFQVISLPAANEPEMFIDTWLGCSWQEDAQQTLSALQNMPIDWLVVDHYAIDQQWENIFACSKLKLLVIDDLANRRHQASLLLNQNLGAQTSDYSGTVSHECLLCLGPDYALLRYEFRHWRAKSLSLRLNQPTQLNRLLISFGGTDPHNATGKTLMRLSHTDLPLHTQIRVLLSQRAPAYTQVKTQLKNLPWRVELLSDVNNMAVLMSESDLCIGAAGGSSWERACLGLPSLLTAIADNQHSALKHLTEHQAALAFNLNDTSLVEQIHQVLQQPTILTECAKQSSQLCDGMGCQRVIQMMQQCH